jgi:DNA gyrase subunit A
MATRRGRVKRVALAEFATVRPSGLIAINLTEGDELGWVRLTNGNDELILVTEQGKAVRFMESEVRSMGRTAAGVTGIKLAKNDLVASMEVVEPGGDLLVVTTKGYGKRTLLTEYPVKSRATAGLVTINIKAIKKIGKIAAARVVQEGDELTIISSNGQVLRTKVSEVKQAGRATRGVGLISLQADDSVASLARIAAADLRRVGAAQNGDQ